MHVPAKKSTPKLEEKKNYLLFAYEISYSTGEIYFVKILSSTIPKMKGFNGESKHSTLVLLYLHSS